VERAAVHGAVAEETQADAIGALVLQRVCGAHREWNVAADDPVAPVESALDVEEVH